MLNLHTVVRGAITSVNPDTAAVWRSSTGYTTADDGAQTATYAESDVTIQVQAAGTQTLRHAEMQNIQGVMRDVYMWGNTQGVVRPDAKGGDLLVFPGVRGGGVAQTWLVFAVMGTWAPDGTGFCKLGVVLQL